LTALLLGTLLALGALSYVLYPLLMGDGAILESRMTRGEPGSTTNRTQAIDALREIEFDRATGKLSDADYDSLKASYTERALTAMRAGGNVVCENCGPRPETDARFCSRCGRAL
jgi:hypothetical protein